MFGYSDADFAGDTRTRRSTSGFVVYCMGCVYAWGSKLMVTIATSTMENEYMAAYYLGQQILHARGQLREIGLALTRPTLFLMERYHGRYSCVENPYHALQTKHIDIKFKWLASLEATLCVMRLEPLHKVLEAQERPVGAEFPVQIVMSW